MKYLKLSLFILSLGLLSLSLFAYPWHRMLSLECKPSDIVLSDGRVIKDYIATDQDEIFLSSKLVENILGKQVYWHADDATLYIGDIPTSTVMSDKVKIYHYDYDNIHAFLYSPDAKTNKAMTMGGQKHSTGYYFSNVFSASFNLDHAYHEITGLLGCEDFKASDGQVDFYLDDTLIASYTIKADHLPERITLDVTDGSKLTLTFSHFKPDTQIDFADVYIH